MKVVNICKLIYGNIGNGENNMGIKIVHLSDLHFNKANKSDHFMKLDPLISQIENHGNKEEDLVIIVSGDVAYSGKKEEYREASRFFKKLRAEASTFFLNAYILFVPGNHDCDFGDEKYIFERQKIIDDILETKTSPTVQNVRYVSKPLNNYFDFERNVSSYLIRKSPLHHTKKLMFGNIHLNINLINTAWMSSISETKSILMPSDLFDFSEIDIDKSKKLMNFYVYHHPRSWFKSEDDHSLREIIESDNGVIFTGHEHVEDTHVKTKEDSSLYYSVVGSFEGNNSCFKVMTISDNGEIEEVLYNWNDLRKMYIISDEKNIDESFLSQKNSIRPTIEYSEFLQDLGMIVIHPKQKDVSLSDLYINPYLMMKVSKSGSQEVRIKDDNLIESLVSEGKCIIDGDYGSGKTILAKSLITEFITQNNIAIYIDLSEAKDALNAEVRLKNYIGIIIRNQYGKEIANIFDSLPKKDRIIFVDNYNYSYENENHIEILNSYLFDYFGKVYLFTNNKTLISGNLKIDKHLIDFNHYSIESYGPKLQKKIVEKWNLLDKDLTDEERYKKNKQDTEIIKNLVDNNNLPNTPEVLLTILSTIQVKHHDQTSLYGYLLNHLISISMERSNIRTLDHDETFRVLSVFAYQLYIKESRWLEKNIFEKIIQEDNDKFDLDVSPEKVIFNLTNANILQKDKKIFDRKSITNDNYKLSFRYSYLLFPIVYW